MSERVAVVCVHGVAPHPRYEFQDQVSDILRERLSQNDGDWIVDVVNPQGVLPVGTDDPWPTISRVRKSDDEKLEQTSYDVTEAYWSPIDKDATNTFSVVMWILRTVFVPLNTVARIQSSLAKQFFDYAFIGGALVLAFILFDVSLWAVWVSLNRILDITGLFRQATVSDALTVLNSTANAPGGHPVSVVLWLFVGTIGAFIVGQALAAIASTIRQRGALLANRISIWHRAWPIALLVFVGASLIYAMAAARFAHGYLGWDGVGFLVLIFVAFQIGRGLLVSFILQFFGDVQVYTTRDENDARFFGLRDAIMDTAVTAIMRAVSPRLNGGQQYDRVIVLAHSLGATIATDALVRLKQACEQGALTAEEFGRIRAFIMLGSSLEKTLYFFDVTGSAVTESEQTWRGGLYDKIFDDDRAVIAGKPSDKIFWINYWYFQDPICNEIQSYEGICRNEQGNKHISLVHPMLHSDYLYDPWFWFSSGEHLGALDVITGAGADARA